MEENATVLPAHSDTPLKPLLEECGYVGARLAVNYRVGDVTYPLVGFASKPWDFDSACIAVVDTVGSAEEAVKSCRDLGAPVVWVRQKGSVEWWAQHRGEPTRFGPPMGLEFTQFVREREADLRPLSVYRAKALGRLPGAKQLDFVDVGLLPMLREQAGEKLGSLVEGMTRVTLKGLGQRDPSKATLRDVFTRVFRLVAGKILEDKGVGDFGSLELADPAGVLRAVGKHYSAADAGSGLSVEWKSALKTAASLLTDAPNLRVVSPETLAYVYEHTLVSKVLRKKLGIHATPPWLVDYIVWQLYDWIREIPVNDRHVFEPACGHAPFLLASMRMLRMEMQDQTESKVHTYLKQHIHGVELDDFAREIARLSLTLADIPNPNGWDLKGEDMYESNVLAKEAGRCRILLSNPPYERFKPADKRRYAEVGFPVQHRKAVELLDRTLQYLPSGAVFGVVVPQGALHNTDARDVRDRLLRDFELRELCLFADKVFEWGDAETAIILGRRRTAHSLDGVQVIVRRVREDSVPRFAETYAADAEQAVPQKSLGVDEDRSLRLPDLPEVWSALGRHPTLGDVADIGQGFSFAQKGLIAIARDAGARKTAGAVPAFLSGVRSLSIWQTPKSVWLSPSRTPVLTWRSGNYSGKPQVLVNYSPVMRGPWRIKALLDKDGHAVTNTYTTVRPYSGGPSAAFLWAVLNSPIANAYVYCNALKRHIYDSLIKSLPLPLRWEDHFASILAAADAYIRLVSEPDGFELRGEDRAAACETLLAMDAAVMRAYALPLRLERAVLDLFRLPPSQKEGRRRKGVGCVFGDYYPAGFRSLVPLHKFISYGYRGSTVDHVIARMKPSESSAASVALRAAAAAFGGD
ncbi:MAG: N-6 DNA methylase [Phycisphaerales bacterium]|nr:N-6 DNA methylase [Phycisphaerales bacterium]